MRLAAALAGHEQPAKRQAKREGTDERAEVEPGLRDETESSATAARGELGVGRRTNCSLRKGGRSG